MSAPVINPAPATVSAASQRRVFNHFALRVRERFGDRPDPLTLWRALVRAMRLNDGRHLRLVVRMNRQGRRMLVCRLADGRALFVLVDDEIGLPITVFREGMIVRPEGRGEICLEVPDGFR